MTDDPRCSKDFQWLESRIVEHRSIAKDTWQLTLEAPSLARCTLPGQFFMVRLAGLNDPLIGRALAMFDRGFDSQGNPETVSVAYVVKGKFTQALSRFKAGQTVEIWGPLGNAFSNQPVDHLILVAGGVGITPMLSLASAALGQQSYGQSPSGPLGASKPQGHFAKQVTLCYGARTQEYLVALDVFESRGVRLAIATEDGSLGHRGRVTEVLKDLLSRSEGTARIACCGPEPMMQAVSKIAHEHNVPCEVSLETPMACGIGICFTCVAKIDQGDGTWDYRRTCVEGPIFESQSIVW
jgi:dihydroorotate dehydrogenase electron transfer subunit